jgi:hypothetical protein
MNMGRRAEAIFGGKKDYIAFIKLLKETVELWYLRISAYCLLKNSLTSLFRLQMPTYPDVCDTLTAFIPNASTRPII